MGKKSPFEDLDDDFKNSIASMSDEEIKKRISEVAVAEHENLKAKQEDMDLAQAVDAARVAGEQYREATKANKLRIAYAYDVLRARGKV